MRTRILPVLLLAAAVLWPAVSGAAQAPAAGSGSGGTGGASPVPGGSPTPGTSPASDPSAVPGGTPAPGRPSPPASASVAPTPGPVPEGPLVEDAFSRSVAPGWGTAPVGGLWEVDGARDGYSVSRGTAWLELDEPGASRAASQPSSAADVEIEALARPERLPVDGNLFVYLVARRAGASELRLKARIATSGEVYLQATTVVDGLEQDLGDEVPLADVRLTDGTGLLVRGHVHGASPTRVRFRAWPEGAPEPTDWTVDVLTSTASLQGAGATGVRAYLGGSVTNAPLRVGVDDWRVTVAVPIPDPTATPTPIETAGASPPPGASPSPSLSPTPSPGPLDLVVADRFRRVSERGWGETPEGLRWNHGGGVDHATVDGRSGSLRTEPGATVSALVSEVSIADVQATATVRATLPTGGAAWLYLVLRRTPEGDEARGRVHVLPDGSVRVSISLVVDGEERTIGPELALRAVDIGPSRPVRVRFAAHGSAPTTWSIRAWPAAAAEPDTWPVMVEDATPSLQGPGGVGLRGYVGRATAVDEVVFHVDGYTLRPVADDVVTSPLLAGAGDIATCGSSGAAQTAALLDGIDGSVFAVGDLAYPDGTPEQFEACFGPTWGRFRDRMLPALGNRDYATPGAAGYFDYFGERAAGPGGWYAVDLGAWRIYVLNSECPQVACGEGSEQLGWLAEDLAANPRRCSLALWHSPRFTSGPHGDSLAVAPFWQLLHAAGAELVVSGHDHDYERLLPMDPRGRLDTEHGVVQFVAGTGGGGGATFEDVRANSVVREGSTLGVLKLTLHPDGYDWRFLPVTGRTFTDSGSRACHDAP